MKNKLLHFKAKVSHKITNIKNKAQNVAQVFKENFKKSKETPRSKIKSLLLGFTTVIGVLLVPPVLSVIAKKIPKKAPKPSNVCPTPPKTLAILPSKIIVTGLDDATATICSLAISSGSFVIDGICGVIVVVGILKTQVK